MVVAYARQRLIRFTALVTTSILFLLTGGMLVLASLFAAATEPELFDYHARFPIMLYGGLLLLLPLPLLAAGRLYRIRSFTYWMICLGLSAVIALAMMIVIVTHPGW